MLDKKIETIIIPESCRANRLDQALARLLPNYSRTQIQQWIDTGNILLNGQTCQAKTKLKGGETVTVAAVFKPIRLSQAQDIPLTIVFEDEEILIINKPVGLVVHPGAGNADGTLLNALLHHAPQLQLLPRAGIIHRLDKDTSGLLVIAKTPLALKKLSQQLKKRSLQREYQAIVCGLLISGGTVDEPIGRHPLQRKRMAINETGKPAQTHYRIAERYRAHTRLKIRLETGRTHQIRVHMAYIHHPIVGDPVYGGRVQLAKGMLAEAIDLLRNFKRQALHADALGLYHPQSDEWMRWEIELPEDIEQLSRSLRADLLSKKNEE